MYKWISFKYLGPVNKRHTGLKQPLIHRGHEFIHTILYGPVRSRRYGLSLGLNILPTDRKVCSFNCVYCQLGKNSRERRKDRFPSTKKIVAELKNCLPEFLSRRINTIALSGNGEPTLHPAFDRIVATILALRKKCRHEPKIVCLTNGAELKNDGVKRALNRIDECCLKVDANPVIINRPQLPFDQRTLIRQTRHLKNLVVQSCFFDGKVGNIDTGSVREWVNTVARLDPKRIDIYTISRRTPTQGLRAVSKKQLKKIAASLRLRAPVKVRVCL